MTTFPTPGLRPANPNFSSGPCAKRPGWSLDALAKAALGRSHRAKIGKSKLEQAIELTREVLQVPAGYRIGIVPASDTGAVEMALWSLLGERGVDMVAWESPSARAGSRMWSSSSSCRMSRIFEARLWRAARSRADRLRSRCGLYLERHDLGVRVPNAEFIPAERAGLTICDATSAAFAQRLDFAKLDVVTFSWQKVLGGEGAHGVLDPVARAPSSGWKATSRPGRCRRSSV